MPSFVEQDKVFSSVLRISSPGVQLWTHYDIMDNFLIQLNGTKRVLLFPPECYNHLYVQKSSSEVLNVDYRDEEFPLFEKARDQALEVILHPGDILFIPALWFHSIRSITFSVGVNIFVKNLPTSLYERKDVYGNKDLVPFTKAVEALKEIKQLPPDYCKFYLNQIQNLL